jgi:hypothetical protein
MSKKMEDYIELSNSISWKNKKFVQDILSKNKNLDLLYRDGKFFNMAIENDCIDIVRSLVSYFNEYQLAKYTSGSTEYLLLKNKLRSTLETAIEDVELSQEMKEALSPYIDFEGSENNDNSLEDEHLENHLISKDQIKVSALKKSHSENNLHSTFDNSKENLLTEENLKRLSNNSYDEKLKFTEEFLTQHYVYPDLPQKEYHSDLAGNLHTTDEF